VHALSGNKIRKLSQEGVRKFIISVGTVDLLRLQETSTEQAQLAEEILKTVINMSQQIQHENHSSSICYIIPAPNHKIVQDSYNTFANHLAQKLEQTNIRTVSATDVMESILHTTEDLHKNILHE